MKMKSVSGITCFVENVNRTAEFYEKLGFTFRKREADHATAYLNWFWIDFLPVNAAAGTESRKAAQKDSNSAGLSTCISVEDLDEFYQGLLAAGFKPATQPVDTSAGGREFALRDPDGYKLVFFKRK